MDRFGIRQQHPKRGNSTFLGVGFEPNMRIGFDILIYDCDDYESGILRELVWAGGESQYGLTLRAGRYESGEIVLVE